MILEMFYLPTVGIIMNLLVSSCAMTDTGEMQIDDTVTETDAPETIESELTFQDFAQRLICGEDIAATELLDRFSARLILLARTRMSSRLTTKTDPEDVVQSVMRTFFRRLGRRELELRDWPSLWGLLSLLTIRKCAMGGRAYGTAARDVHREVQFSECSCPSLSIPSREPTPLEVSTFVDLLEQLVASGARRDRLVIEGMMTGESVHDLAETLGCTERTIYRVTERLRKTLWRMAEMANG